MRTPFIKGCATDSTKDHANVAIFTTWSSQCHPLLISKGWFLSNAIWGQHLTWNSLNSPNNRKMVNQTDTSLPPPMATDDSGSDSLEIIWAQLQATTGCHLVNIGSKTHMNEHISLISSCLELWWQLIIKTWIPPPLAKDNDRLKAGIGGLRSAFYPQWSPIRSTRQVMSGSWAGMYFVMF